MPFESERADDLQHALVVRQHRRDDRMPNGEWHTRPLERAKESRRWCAGNQVHRGCARGVENRSVFSDNAVEQIRVLEGVEQTRELAARDQQVSEATLPRTIQRAYRRLIDPPVVRQGAVIVDGERPESSA